VLSVSIETGSMSQVISDSPSSLENSHVEKTMSHSTVIVHELVE